MANLLRPGRERAEDAKTSALREATAVLQKIVDQWGSPDIKEILDRCNAALGNYPRAADVNASKVTLHLPL
jgi:hypothetical protein